MAFTRSVGMSLIGPLDDSASFCEEGEEEKVSL